MTRPTKPAVRSAAASVGVRVIVMTATVTHAEPGRVGGVPYSRPLLRQARVADRRDVPVVRAAATSEHRQPRELLPQLGVARGEVGGIPRVELLRLVELRVAECRGVRAEPRDPLPPFAVSLEHGVEVRWVGAVDHVVARTTAGLAVDLF